MTLPKFTSRAIDLSGIAAAAKAPPVPPGASFVIEVDEQNFESVMQLSTRHPSEWNSPRRKSAGCSETIAHCQSVMPSTRSCLRPGPCCGKRQGQCFQ